ncbi:MAG: 50S ribosomal protein L13 [Candidatus Hydrogenedentota bacterium]|jgi:large subunit ribosomal protein L13|uniref:Large ribosomal subunit protein uL13 n=1 Tax=Sumerlaea chitinivorans TaxID=2250252 RepID=A0A2Z4Y3E4_SUMC1|nr:LSU ribosomal protein L13p (L13Ae) [Candidatus Sumerlaea chitinivorans]MCX7963475.1 50S ribosomal protein L13 [Candidatus Sumerlaea chitinivorans]RMH31235.1 MAG: 50S ribosomal protein L13 [Candidatus Hydrogenedentota bacterium]GIX45410.1 MAG: 50S ribosomal protein L13 [Candidatus Sumerlaea sp.]
MKTFYPRPGDIQEKWYLVDAKGEVVGRLASRVAALLRGKMSPSFHPAVNPKTHVVIINADKAVLTADKMKTKLYRRHSGYPGGLKEATAEELSRKKPGEILRLAIKGMLPKTRLGDRLITHVKVYAGETHPHTAQKPEPIKLTKRAAQ